MAKLHTFLPLPLVVAAALLIAMMATHGIASSQSGNGKYDTDGDGLIEIEYLEQLDAIRYDSNGDGDSAFQEYYEAFPIFSGESVCPNVCNGYELVRPLDFYDPESYSSGQVKVEWTTGRGWQPIGFSEVIQLGFNATFDGNHNAISNLYINQAPEEHISYIEDSAGLFNTTLRSNIHRVGMVDVDIMAFAPAGGLVGQNSGTIEGCYVTGSVTVKGFLNPDGTGYSTRYAGGLVGINNGTIRSSHANTRVFGDGKVGGLVGYNTDPIGIIIGSYASGVVTDRNADNEFGEFGSSIGDSIGGLVGENNGIISTSYATAEVSGDNQVGGLVGQAFYDSIIRDSYATGRVRGLSAIGGLVGDNYGKVDFSYATGFVSGDSSIGGLIGRSAGVESAQIKSSYWETDSPQIQDNGFDGSTIFERYGEPKTTAELQNPTSKTGIYSEWNPALWDFGTSNQYAVLKADVDGDGVATWQEFGNQRRQSPAPTARPTATSTPVSTTGAADSNARPSAEVFGELVRAGLLASVWRYHNATASWDGYDPNIPAELNDLTHAAPKDIVWVKVTETTQFQGRTLHKGWNLITLK